MAPTKIIIKFENNIEIQIEWYPRVGQIQPIIKIVGNLKTHNLINPNKNEYFELPEPLK